MIETVQTSIDNKIPIAGVFLDLSKAFDVVDHSILLSKLEYYGIRGQTLSWFESYLTNRQQYTVVNNTKSKLGSITHGVPQGSILGPLLFLIYVNDMNCALDESCNLRLFADDTNIFITAPSYEKLKTQMLSVLERLSGWFSANKLIVNIEKTCYTVFSGPRSNVPDFLNTIFLQNMTIKRTRSTKYLGIYVDEKLSWNDHIDNLHKSLVKISNSFKIIRNHVSPHNLKLLFSACFASKVN
jgi:hypothetical protein